MKSTAKSAERRGRHAAGRKCSVCVHAQREEIDGAIVGGEELRAIEGRFGVSRFALGRHKDHIIELVARSPEAQKFARADTIVAQIVQLEDEALKVLNDARFYKDGRLALSAISEMKSLLEFRAKVAGALKPKHTNIVSIHFEGKEGLDDRLGKLIERARAIDVKPDRAGNALPAAAGE